MEFITLFFIVFWGWVNSYFAQKRGRNPYLWFFLGVFFGPFPLIALFLMPSFESQEKTEEKPKIIETEAIRVSPHSPFDQYDWYYLDEARKQHGPHTIVRTQKIQRKGPDFRRDLCLERDHDRMEKNQRQLQNLKKRLVYNRFRFSAI